MLKLSKETPEKLNLSVRRVRQMISSCHKSRHKDKNGAKNSGQTLAQTDQLWYQSKIVLDLDTDTIGINDLNAVLSPHLSSPPRQITFLKIDYVEIFWSSFRICFSLVWYAFDLFLPNCQESESPKERKGMEKFPVWIKFGDAE